MSTRLNPKEHEQEVPRRMSVRSKINETKLATHLLVKFHEDDQTSVIPVKRVTSPAVSTLEPSATCTCTVRWSDNKMYKATVLAMGDDASMREEQRKLGSGNKENSMNTANPKSRKRSAIAASLPPLKKKKLATTKTCATTKKKTANEQLKDTFVLETGSPPPNDPPPNKTAPQATADGNPPASTGASPQATVDSNLPASTGTSPMATADSNLPATCTTSARPPATNPKVKNKQ